MKTIDLFRYSVVLLEKVECCMNEYSSLINAFNYSRMVLSFATIIFLNVVVEE